MITVSKQENGVLFTFTNSDKYLYGSGTIEVPFNSLSIIQDESDNITLRKSASNDIFLSARYDTDFGYASKEEAVNALKEILYDEAGISEEEVQEMIDAATSGIPSSEVIEQLRTDVNTLSGTVSSHTADTTVHFTGAQKSNYDGLEVLYHAEGNWDIMPQSAFNDFTNDYSTAMGQFDQRITANASAVTAVSNDLNTLSGEVDTKVDAITYESGQYATAQALNALQENKLDASAYTPTDLSEYWTSGQTQEAINAATSGIPSSQVIEALRNDINTVSGDVENKQDALSAGTGIEISGNVISATGGALLVNFNDLMENMNDEKWDELVDALQNNKPIFEGYNNSEEGTTEQNIVDGYVYQDEYIDTDDEFGTTVFVEIMSLRIDFSGGYRELIITKKGSEDYEVSEYSDNYQPMGDYQPMLQVGSGISIDGNNVISVTGAPITVDSELDETSNNPVANSAITNVIIDNEEVISRAINDLNDRLVAVESGGSSVTVDTSLDSGSTNPVANSAITNAIDDAKAYYVDFAAMSVQGITDADWDGLVAAINAHRPILVKIGTYNSYVTATYSIISDNVITITGADGNYASTYTFTKNGSNDYSVSTSTKQFVTQAEKDAWNAKVDTSAITTAITSGSTDSQVPSAKATYDAITAATTGGGATYSAGTNISIDTGNTINCTLNLRNGTSLNSIAGVEGEAKGKYNFAFGQYSTAGTSKNDEYAFAFGYNCKARKSRSFAYGAANDVKEIDSAAFGQSITLNAPRSFAAGYNNVTNNWVNIALGEELTTNNRPEFATGVYNNSVTGSTASGQTLFSVGNGASASARHNAFEIRQNGDIYVNDGTNDVRLQDTILALGGLKFVKLTQAQYDAIATKDSSTLYIISD